MTRTIAELIDAEIRCSPVSRELEKITEIHSPLTLPAHRPAATIYEYEVFNFLVSNKRRLGIQRVLKFENLIIDGAIVLDDGRPVLVEIKSQMGWMKACQAEWQLRTFLRLPAAKPYDSGLAVVFFESFSGDWARPVARTLRGWRNWYSDHCLLGRSPQTKDGLRISLVRLKGGVFETAPVE